MNLEVQIRDPNGGTRKLQFARSPIRIGRNQLNDISLENPFVSEWHGIIRFDDETVAYFDLGSTNGTILDGKRLPKNVPAALNERSRLQLGTLELFVARQREDAATVPPPVAPSPPGPQRRETGASKTLVWGSEAAAKAVAAAVAGSAGGAGTGPAARSTSSSGPHRAVDPVPAAGGGAPQRSGAIPVVASQPGSPMPGMHPSLAGAAAAAARQAVAAAAAAGQSQPHAAVAGPNDALVWRQTKLLEAFSEAFVGLRKGYEQFGAEVGVRTVSGSTALHRARTSRELLDHMMSPDVDPTVAARELIAIFADLGIHHIALMEGITEAVRALLQSVDPRANDLDVGSRLFTAAKTKSQWKQYLERIEQLITDDNELHAAIFGDEFARAYATVTLGDGPDRRDSDEKKR